MILNEIVQQFVDWTKKKIRHHCDEDRRELYFREKEIWWAALGKNIGYEMDGKYEYFSRPVLVVKKYSASMCFVLPLTTQIKPGFPPYQYQLNLFGKQNAINLSQGRTISSKRLLDKLGNIKESEFDDILNKFVRLLRN